MSGIVLSSARASCRYCDHTVAQIDTSREHAVQVVVSAMESHMLAEHPDVEARAAEDKVS